MRDDAAARLRLAQRLSHALDTPSQQQIGLTIGQREKFGLC
ncbi:hypothetical protein [Paraburkholderia caribensis]|nr:hypothetical protein [Paraburkholderia caribensis]